MTDAAQEAAEDPLASPALHRAAVSPAQAVFFGIRQPIVMILLLIAFFTTISGKPLDGFLMLTVATLLVWDAARVRLGSVASGSGPEATPALFTTVAGGGGPEATPIRSAAAVASGQPARAHPTWFRLLSYAPWLAGGLVYAGVVGGFKRYSWPVTIAVVALGCLMVAIGWQGPVRRRAALTGRALRRAWIWAVILIAGGLWELSSLLQQPHLTTDSYAHPTISALTDPLLASHPGRSVALGAWLLIGWFLAGR